MLKEWFISIDGKQEGPFTALELKRHPFVTPDTLVWRQGLPSWIAIRYIPELKEVFKDEPDSEPTEERIKPTKHVFPDLKQQEDTLTVERDPFQFFIWLLIIAIILFYTFSQIFYK